MGIRRLAFDVCADMLRQAMKPNMVSYSTLISACEKGKEMRRAFGGCEDMQVASWASVQCAHSALSGPGLAGAEGQGPRGAWAPGGV